MKFFDNVTHLINGEKMKASIFIFIFAIIYNASIIMGQNFICSPMISISGDNYDFDISSPPDVNSFEETYLCWINQQDSIYTVYLKEISPTDGENVIISRDSLKKSNPQISLNKKIAWQNFSNGMWQVLYRSYQNDFLNAEEIIADSIQNDPQITMNIHRIAWIDDGKLLIKEFYPELSEAFTIDSIDCSSPYLISEDYLTSSKILYEKGPTGSKQIFLAELNKYVSEKWNISQLSQGNNNINPRFGLGFEMAFQTFFNNIWKVVYTKMPEMIDTTNNVGYSYKNPIVFTYPIPTSSDKNGTPFFLAFDTDSTNNNSNSIFINTFGYGIKDSIMSISNIPGNNYEPNIAYLNYVDSAYISIIWTREINSKKDIWIAKDKFIPKWTNVNERSSSVSTFSLRQNYPNPFNPTTTIEYYVAKPSFILLTIYNLLGEEIDRPVQEFKRVGKYQISFNGDKYPNGIYFYNLKADDIDITKSMLIVH